jgi:PAS domain S-box-containing protein
MLAYLKQLLRSRQTIFRTLLLLALWWLSCWFGVDLYTEKMSRSILVQEKARAQSLATNIAVGYHRIVTVRTGMPRLLARSPETLRALRQAARTAANAQSAEERQRRWTSDPVLAATNLNLRSAARDFGLDNFWLLTADGDCIAAGNSDTASSQVGQNLADSDYFQAARQGLNGHQLSAEQKDLPASLVFYAPIRDNGHFLGVVAASVSFTPFGNWLDPAKGLVSDQHGVIVLAYDKNLTLHALPGADVDQLPTSKRTSLYSAQAIPPLDLRPWRENRFPELMTVSGQAAPVLIQQRQTPGVPTITLLHPVPSIAGYIERQQIWFLSLSLLGSLAGLLGFGAIRHWRELRARETKFRRLVETLPDHVIRYDTEGRIRDLNSKLAAMLEMNPEQLVGKHPREVWPDGRWSAIQEAARQTQASGVSRNIEIEQLDADGNRLFHLIHCAPERDENGEIVGTVAFCRDLTPLKQAEERLALVQAALDRGRDAAILADHSGAVIYTNPAACALLGYSAEEYRQLHLAALLPCLAGKDKPAGGEKPAAKDEVTLKETVGNARDASQIPVEASIATFEYQGASYSLTMLRDISERKRMENELVEESAFRETLLNAMGDAGIQLLLIENGRVIYVGNRPLAYRVGYTDAELDACPPLLEFIHPDERERVGSNYLRRLAGEDVPSRYELALISRQGERLEYETTIALVPNSNPVRTVAVCWEIGERKQMEAELRQREHDFRSLAESSPDFIIRYDIEHRIRYLNGGLVKQLGLADAAPVVGKRPIEVWPDGRYRAIDEATTQAHQSGQAVTVDLAEPGDSRQFQILVVPERDMNGQIVGTLAFGRDVTAIHEAERRLRHFIENLPGMAFIFRQTPHGECSIPYASSGIEDIYGLQPDDVKNAISPLRKLTHPEDQPRIQAAIIESAHTNTPLRIESRVCRPDQPERRVEIRATHTLNQGDGSIVGYGIMLDISERKRLEQLVTEKHRRLLADAQHIAQLGSWELDLGSGQIDWSEGISRILELTPRQGTLSIANLLAVVHPDDRERVEQAYADPANPDSPQEIEYRLQFPSGRIKYVHERRAIIDGTEGVPLHVTAAIQDVTAAREIARRLSELTRHREELLEEERKRIARDLHEDLGQVLSSLRMGIGTLRLCIDGEKNSDINRILLHHEERIDLAIEGMRRSVAALRPTALDHGIDAALQTLVQDFSAHTGIPCQLHFPANTAELSEARATGIFRIVQEALTNIMRYAGASHVEITLEQLAGEWRIRIKDDGCGFDTKEARPQSFGLLGMGERAQMLEGSLTIDSAPGQGTTITATFPARS